MIARTCFHQELTSELLRNLQNCLSGKCAIPGSSQEDAYHRTAILGERETSAEQHKECSELILANRSSSRRSRNSVTGTAPRERRCFPSLLKKKTRSAFIKNVIQQCSIPLGTRVQTLGCSNKESGYCAEPRQALRLVLGGQR